MSKDTLISSLHKTLLSYTNLAQEGKSMKSSHRHMEFLAQQQSELEHNIYERLSCGELLERKYTFALPGAAFKTSANIIAYSFYHFFSRPFNETFTPSAFTHVHRVESFLRTISSCSGKSVMNTRDTIPSELGVIRGDWRFITFLESKLYVHNLFLRVRPLYTFTKEAKQWSLHEERDTYAPLLFSVHPSIFYRSSTSTVSKRFTDDGRVWVGRYPLLTSNSEDKHVFSLHMTNVSLGGILGRWQHVEKPTINYEIQSPKISDYCSAISLY